MLTLASFINSFLPYCLKQGVGLRQQTAQFDFICYRCSLFFLFYAEIVIWLVTKTLHGECTTAECFKNTLGKFLLPLQSKGVFAVNLRRKGDQHFSCGCPKMCLMFVCVCACLLCFVTAYLRKKLDTNFNIKIHFFCISLLTIFVCCTFVNKINSE